MNLSLYQETINISLSNTLIISLFLTISSLIIGRFKTTKSTKNINTIDIITNSILSFIMIFLFGFVCLSFLLYAATNLWQNIDFSTLHSIDFSTLNFQEQIVTRIKTLFSLFTTESVKNNIALYIITIIFSTSSIYFLITGFSQDKNPMSAICLFSFYFSVIGFLWYFTVFDPLELKREYIINISSQAFSEYILNNKISIYTKSIDESKSICNSLLKATNFLFVSIYDDWLIINSYRQITNGGITKWHSFKMKAVNSVLTFTIGSILLISSFEVASGINYYNGLQYGSFSPYIFPQYLSNYYKFALVAGAILSFIGIGFIIFMFLFKPIEVFFNYLKNIWIWLSNLIQLGNKQIDNEESNNH